jgi:transposase
MAHAETWSERIAEWRASGLTAREFCSGRDFAVTALYWWSSKLGRASRTKRSQPVRLARVVRQMSTASHADTNVKSGVSPALVLIELDGVRVFVTAGVERATLANVFDALEERVRGAAR